MSDSKITYCGAQRPYEQKGWMSLAEAKDAVAGDAVDVYEAVWAGRLEMKNVDGKRRFRFPQRSA